MRSTVYARAHTVKRKSASGRTVPRRHASRGHGEGELLAGRRAPEQREVRLVDGDCRLAVRRPCERLQKPPLVAGHRLARRGFKELRPSVEGRILPCEK